MPITPSWSESTVITPQVLARGSTLRATLDLRTKHGARLLIRLGRGGTAALTNGVDVLIRTLWNNDVAAGGPHPASVSPQLSQTAAANSTTVDADSASGQAVLNVASTTGFVAGDFICIQDSGGGVTRLEFQRISKITNPGASGELNMDRPLAFTHTAAQADTVRNKSDAWTPWLPGGSLYEVIFDYGDDAAGDSVTVEVRAQTYDQDNT